MTIEDIRQASWDARINLTPAEEHFLSKQVENIVKQAEFLQDGVLEKVKSTYYPLSQQNKLRTDIAAPSMSREKAMLNAPDADEFFFHVPKIVE